MMVPAPHLRGVQRAKCENKAADHAHRERRKPKVAVHRDVEPVRKGHHRVPLPHGHV